MINENAVQPAISSQGLRSDRFHELDKFRFYLRFNLTKASVLHFLILIEEYNPSA
jgi:hypothetical protein